MDVWEKVFQERGEVPIVFPIIFYHGKSAWNYETDIRKYIKDYDELPAYMKERLPTLKHDFITMETHDEERMYEYEPLTRFILRSFKFIFTDIDELVRALLISVDDMHGNVADEEMQAYIELILFYYSQANKHITEEMLIEKIRKSGGKGAELLTIFEAKERKGMQEGIKKGIQEGIEMNKEELAQNMLKDGLAVEFVAKYAKLSVKKVEELREKLE